MPLSTAPRRTPSVREDAVASALAIAVSLVAFGAGVRAQSFQGTPTVVVPGSASVFATGGTTTVTVNAPTAVINWAPNDTAIGGGPINFQPAGTTATFRGSSGVADYAILNNILPTDATRAVQFNGTIVSQLQDAAGNTSVGGTVYFYSPGGILVGPSAAINVGNLGLSASPIAYDSTSGAFGATGSVPGNAAQTVHFGQANAGSSVQIASGAQINANTLDGSYVAVVAPVINNQGAINVNGNAALVAADAATITFSPDGLYSVAVDAGTSATGAVLSNGGSIVGAAANRSGGGPAHQIYLVTAPKNTLISMLVSSGSNLGFDVAGSADTFGNTVVLSGGYNVVHGVSDTSNAPIGFGTSGSVNTQIDGANLTSRTVVAASGSAFVTSGSAATPTNFAYDLELNGLSTASIQATNGGTVTVNGYADVSAIDQTQFAAQNGTVTTGGSASIFATQGGTVSLKGADSTVSASEGGGNSSTDGVNAGNGKGGFASVTATNGGTISVDKALGVYADGYGGNAFGQLTNAQGGSGQGGSATVGVSDGNGTITVGGNLYVSASGYGGRGTCTATCTAEGGNGTGGTVQLYAIQGTTTPGGGSSISATAPADSPNGSGVQLHADGTGSDAFNTNAGNGTGGSVFITLDAGNSLNLADTLSAGANGYGGGSNGVQQTGGTGTGGLTQVVLHNGATLNAVSLVDLVAQGFGGAGFAGESAGNDSNGGSAVGGTTRLFADGGNATFQGGFNVDSAAFGGSASANTTIGVGGAATGGSAFLTLGTTTLSNNPQITFTGTATIAADGHGGQGFVGGTGTAGTALTRVFYGQLTGGDLVTRTDASGGDAYQNGTGGNAVAGSTQVLARNNAFGTSNITVDSARLSATATGGLGGGSSNTAISAGNGGNATGGQVIGLADAGDGKFVVRNQIAGYADASGGGGGTGAYDEVNTGGLGGNGGSAVAGNVQIGTQSGAAGTTSAGTATFGNFLASASAFGGQGGDGGNVQSSGGPMGNGGNGGAASDGSVVLLVRGSPVTINGDAQLVADAYGGAAGTGAATGNGGTALVGDAGGTGITVTNRFQVPAQRGSLTAGNITAEAFAVSGAGAITGTGTIGDSPLSINLVNGDITATSVVMQASAPMTTANPAPSVVSLTGGTLNAGSTFTFTSNGPITVALDTATLNAGFVELSGSDWILPTAPVLAGTINASSGASFSSDNNIVTYANVNFNYPVSFNVFGNFQLGNVTTNGDFISTSGGTTTLGSVIAAANPNAQDGPSAGNIDIVASNAITTGQLSAAGYVSLDNAVATRTGPGTGDVTAAGITAGRDVSVSTNGAIFVPGLIQAGADVDLSALGAITTADITAGIVNPSTVQGDTFTISANAGGPIVTDNLTAATDIGLLSQQSIATSALGGRDMQLLAAGNIATGTINATARVLLADASMAQAGTSASGYDPNPAFAAVPVRTAGSITVAGNVQSQQFAAAAGQAFSSGAISAQGGPLLIDAGGALSTGSLSATGYAALSSNSTISTGAIVSQDLLVLGGDTMHTGAIGASGRVLFADQRAYALGTTGSSFDPNAIFAGVTPTNLASYRSAGAVQVDGDIGASLLRVATAGNFTAGAITVPNGFATSIGGIATTGDLHVGDGFTLQANGGISTGNVDVGVIATNDPSPSYYAAYLTGGNLVTGNVRTTAGILLSVGGTAQTGTLTTGDVLGLVHGSASYGTISASNRVLLADQSMAALGNTSTPPFFYDPNLVFNATPVASAGAIAVNGSITTGQFLHAATTQGFASGAITTGAELLLSAGGAVQTGALSAGSFADISSGALTAGPITTRRYTRVRASGPVTISGAINAGAQVQLSSSGAITTADVSAGVSPQSTAAGDFYDINIDAGSALVTGNLTSAQATILHSLSTIQAGTISANGVGVLGGGAVTTGAISGGSAVEFANQSFYAGQGTSTYGIGGLVSAVNAQPIVIGTVGVQGPVTINGPVSANQIQLYSAQDLSVAGAVQGNTVGILRAGGNIMAGVITGGASAQAIAGGDIRVGDMIGGTLLTPGQPRTTSVVLVTGNGSIVAGNLRSTTNILLSARQSAQVGAINTYDLLGLVRGPLTTGAISVTGRVLLADSAMAALGNTTTTNPTTGQVVPLFDPNLVFNAQPIASSGPITVNGNISAGQFINVATQGAFTAGSLGSGNFVQIVAGPVSVGPVNAGTFLDLTATGNVAVGGAIQTGNEATINALGGITVGDINAGANSGTTDPVPFSIGLIASGGPVVAGNLTGQQAIGVASSASISTGNLSGSDILVGAGTAIGTGAITTPGRALLANYSMLTLGGTPGSGGVFDANAVFAATPVATAGAISINGAVQTGQFFSAATAQDFTSGNITSGDTVTIAAGGAIQTGSISGVNQVTISADSFTLGTATQPGTMVTTSGGLSISTVQSLTLPSLSISGNLSLSTRNALTTGDLTSTAGSVSGSAGTTLSVGAVNAFTTIGLTANGATNIGNAAGNSLNAVGAITVSGGAVTLVSGNAARSTQSSLTISASGSITADSVLAQTSLNLSAGNNLTLGGFGTNTGAASLSAGGTLRTAGGNAVGIAITAGTVSGIGNLFSRGALSISTTGNFSGAAIQTSAGPLSISSGGTFMSGPIAASGGDLSLSAGGDVLTVNLRSSGAITLASQAGFTNNGTTTAGTGITGQIAGSLQLGAVTATAGDINLRSGGAVALGNVLATAGAVAVTGGGTLATGSVRAGTTLALTAPGAMTLGVLGGDTLNAVGAISVNGGDILIQQGNQVFSSQSSVAINAAGTLTSGTISAQTTNTIRAANFDAGGVNANTGAVTINAPGFVRIGPSNANGYTVNAGTTFQSGNIGSAGSINIATGGNLATAFVTANGGSAVLSSGGTFSAGVINTTGGISISSVGNASVQGLTSSGQILFNAGTPSNVTSTFTSTGTIASAGQIIGTSGGTMTLANVSSSGGAGTIELASRAGNLSAGRVTAQTDIAAIAGGSLSLGQVTGRDIVLLAGSNVQTGAINAAVATSQSTGAVTGATGRVLIANASAGSLGGQFGKYDFNAVFNATGGSVIPTNPPRVGGTVAVGGTVNAGTFRSYAQGAMTGQAINAFARLEVESGGLVTVGQQWASPDITIGSNDLAITPAQSTQTTTTAGLNAGTTGDVTLVSLNPNGAFIGDGLTAGSGYALSAAEVGLVQSGSLTIAAGVSPSATTTMTIGSLAVTAAQVSDTREGTLVFATGNPATEAISGTIRVVGPVTAKNFAAANRVGFQTGTFELDNTAGSIAVSDGSGAPGGGIDISASRIHVAAASILDKLRADPLYAGRVSDLNTPPAQPSSGPALSAAALSFEPTQTLYIQNTGTAAAPVGFLVPLSGLTITPASGQSTTTAPASVSVVINGQFVGSGTATVTGSTAYQQFVNQVKLTGITAESTMNGCAIAGGSCGMATPTPDLSTQITVLTTPTLPSAPAVVQTSQQASAEVTADPQQQDQTSDKPTEGEQKEEEKAAAPAKAPIAPPAPMIDTRPLSPPVSIDEPVAGGGNPALFGNGVVDIQPAGGAK